MLRQLLSNRENCIDITGKLLAELQVKVTNTTLKEDLINHPDYPSLLSISNVLLGYGVKSISFRSGIDKLERIPTPFVAQIKSKKGFEDFFTIVRSFKNNIVHYYNPEKHRWDNISKEDFEESWPSGIILLAETEENAGEKNYVKMHSKEWRANMAAYIALLALPLLATTAGAWAFVTYGATATYPILFLMLSLLGSITGALLLGYEFDQYNSVLQQICSGSRKVNCGAILQSKVAKVAGISWSVIGFSYFAGGLLLMLFTGIVNPLYLFTLAWLNILAVPYVVFSIYYQWRIARQWCVLCLCVQGILVLQLLTVTAAGWHLIVPAAYFFDQIVPVVSAYSVPFLVVSLLIPAYRAAKEGRRTKVELQRLKHNPQVFNSLLTKQKAVTGNTDELGITLGPADAAYKIIKVCNPYCGPCAKAHVPIEDLLHNNPNLQVQIIFTAANSDEDNRAAPVKHLLAIAEKENESVIKNALDDWYLAGNKDYKQFALKYPMNGELNRQGEKLEAMSAWCVKNEIMFTPTFFVNGNRLPEMYSVNDLKYFLPQ